jgi:hypothetical protein
MVNNLEKKITLRDKLCEEFSTYTVPELTLYLKESKEKFEQTNKKGFFGQLFDPLTWDLREQCKYVVARDVRRDKIKEYCF